MMFDMNEYEDEAWDNGGAVLLAVVVVVILFAVGFVSDHWNAIRGWV